MTPSAFEPEAHPEAVLMRAKRLGLIVSRLPSLESGDAPRLTNVAVEDLLLRPSEKIDYARLETLVKGKAVIVTGGGARSARRSAIALRPSALAIAGDREFGAGALCGDGDAGRTRHRRRHRRPHCGHPRSRTGHAADGRIQARHRVPCRGAEACADPRARLERGRQDQHLRIGQRRRRGARGGRRSDGDDLDRQGDRAGLDARSDQAFRRNVLPGARPRSDGAIAAASRTCA